MPNQHDILTGSQLDGRAYTDSADHTCNNWTSEDAGSAQVGHHDRHRRPGDLVELGPRHPGRGQRGPAPPRGQGALPPPAGGKTTHLPGALLPCYVLRPHRPRSRPPPPRHRDPAAPSGAGPRRCSLFRNPVARAALPGRRRCRSTPTATCHPPDFPPPSGLTPRCVGGALPSAQLVRTLGKAGLVAGRACRFSAALLILWAPGGFRFTCYYYRGAYYKAFWADPPSCAVGEPRKSYLGENSFPLILQNVHRYFLYLALLFLSSSSLRRVEGDVVHRPATGRVTFGIGVGTLVLAINVVLLWRLHARLPLVPAPGRRPARSVLESPLGQPLLRLRACRPQPPPHAVGVGEPLSGGAGRPLRPPLLDGHLTDWRIL